MVSLFNCFSLSILLFLLGFSSIIIHDNLLSIFIGLEIIMNAISLLLIITSNYWHHMDGQIMYILSITLAAIEASISLTLLIQYFRKTTTLNVNKLSEIIE